MRTGSNHYKAYVGPIKRYDTMSYLQFCIMCKVGLREHHKLLDIGCGSLRAGKLFIPYLLPGNYYGVEPNKWLVDEGVKNEVGQDLIDIKHPHFLHVDDYSFETFNVKFDFILAQSIFSHASTGDITKCLITAKKCMDKHSVMMVTFVEGDTDYNGDDWVYPGVVKYKPETISKMVQSCELQCKRTSFEHPAQTWYLIRK